MREEAVRNIAIDAEDVAQLISDMSAEQRERVVRFLEGRGHIIRDDQFPLNPRILPPICEPQLFNVDCERFFRATNSLLDVSQQIVEEGIGDITRVSTSRGFLIYLRSLQLWF
ncbi:unnamed protein product [Anisakis simplex]|uniref:EcoEI_R_C domain-containing protein n=1 Tax=Anisakis simplex TaxID=6269 RepID=A0A0M3KJY6_ANISI|nr:unnamed protein product [Anisakis simplex]